MQLEVKVAPFWHRTVALLVDAVPLMTLYALLLFSTGTLQVENVTQSPWNVFDALVDVFNHQPELVLAPCFLGVVTLLAYYLIQELIAGQSVGARLLGITIVTKQGKRPEPIVTLVRNLARLISLLSLGLGYWWAAFDTERRTLHDWIAGTWVVYDSGATQNQNQRNKKTTPT